MADEQEGTPVFFEQARFRLVLVTAPDEDVAQRLGRGLVESDLAACVNLVPGIRSIYRWEGQVQESGEVLMLVKTTREKLEALMEWVKREHPYAVPELISLELAEVELAYGRWIAGE